MDIEEYLINMNGIAIARENIAIKIAEIMRKSDKRFNKEKIKQLLYDRDEINKGNMEVIKKYIKRKEIYE